MKVRENEDYIFIVREFHDSEETFNEAFETGIVTLVVGKESRRVNGIKIWKNDGILKKGK